MMKKAGRGAEKVLEGEDGEGGEGGKEEGGNKAYT